MFTMFLQSLLHSPCALLSRYRKWMNKDSNLKIHRWFNHWLCSHCLVTWILRLRYITGQYGPENNLWFSTNSPGRAVSYYLRAGRAAKVLARAISSPWDHDWSMFCGYFDDVIIRYNEPVLWLFLILRKNTSL